MISGDSICAGPSHWKVSSGGSLCLPCSQHTAVLVSAMERTFIPMSQQGRVSPRVPESQREVLPLLNTELSVPLSHTQGWGGGCQGRSPLCPISLLSTRLFRNPRGPPPLLVRTPRLVGRRAGRASLKGLRPVHPSARARTGRAAARPELDEARAGSHRGAGSCLLAMPATGRWS